MQGCSATTGAKGIKKHMHHIAETRYVSEFHRCLVHKTISIKEALHIPESKAAVDGEWDKNGTILRTGQPGT